MIDHTKDITVRERHIVWTLAPFALLVVALLAIWFATARYL